MSTQPRQRVAYRTFLKGGLMGRLTGSTPADDEFTAS